MIILWKFRVKPKIILKIARSITLAEFSFLVGYGFAASAKV